MLTAAYVASTAFLLRINPFSGAATSRTRLSYCWYIVSVM